MKVTLPDGTPLELPEGASGADAAAAIGPGLARAALAVKQNGRLRDLARPLEADEPLEIVTDRSGQDALDLIRHDAAHVLAAAVMDLYPGVKISIGPPIENGFYYDFDFPDGVSISDADFEAIEAKMREHIAADEPFTREDVAVEQALERFRDEGQDYKVELIEDLVTNDGVETVSLYTNGPFTDLCRGPHAPSTKRIGAFKLQSVAGAYWRGDANRQMLTRVYGTAFFKQAELDAYLEQLELARARDHRKLGRELGLFAFSPVSPGSTFWLPKGTAVFNALVALNRRMQQERGYVEVKTPQLYESQLWETSGHWGKYKDNIFVSEYEDREFGLKPMNCPGHCQLFGLQQWSYRDLPVRYAEPGLLHRREPSGTLHGLLRVRHFIQDDAHIFCTEEQIQDEVTKMLAFAYEIYGLFDFPVHAELSTRPDEPPGRRRALGPRRGGAGQGARAQRHRVLDRRGRGRLLRPEDRPAHDRLARALMAARHDPARLQHARALRADLHGRRQRRAHPGDDAPRALRLLRALHRDPARAHRRRAAALAGARAGHRAADRRPPQRRGQRPPSTRCARPGCARRPMTAPSRSGARSATPSCRRSPTCSWSATARPRRGRSPCAAMAKATRARWRSASSSSGSPARPPPGPRAYYMLYRQRGLQPWECADASHLGYA